MPSCQAICKCSMFCFCKTVVIMFSNNYDCLICFQQGDGVPATRKGACANHVKDINRFFKVIIVMKLVFAIPFLCCWWFKVIASFFMSVCLSTIDGFVEIIFERKKKLLFDALSEINFYFVYHYNDQIDTFCFNVVATSCFYLWLHYCYYHFPKCTSFFTNITGKDAFFCILILSEVIVIEIEVIMILHLLHFQRKSIKIC